MLTAEILSIGDELLIGQVINSNASYISEQLNAIGIDVRRVSTIGDSRKEILQAMKRAYSEHDIVIATGGLGPTHDDISKAVVAAFFKKKLVLHKPTLARVRKRFLSYGYKKMPEANIGQAMIPQDFIVLPNDRGTAPGLLYTLRGKTFIILPGVPHEMRSLMEHHALALLKKTYKKKLGNAIVHRTLLTTGIGESLLAERVGDVAEFLGSGATLAYLPKISGVRMRISVRAANERAAKQAIARAEKHIRSRVGEHIYGTDTDTLEEVVVSYLRRRKETISTAESCTGGMISARLTNVAGSSEVFFGGVVSYANNVKTDELNVPASVIKTYGAVSGETARAMAEGARKKFGTTYSVAATGIAGPGGGTKEKPVGTVWIALATAKGVTAKRFLFGGERQVVRERAADAALEMIRTSIQ